MKKNKILVTGGCGYIGSHTLIELLEQNKYEVIAADSLVNSSAEALENVRKITGKSVKFYETDLCDATACRQIFSENPDLVGVIHFAALKSVPDSVKNPLLYYNNNLGSQANVLQACADFGVPNFIFSSSCSVYGNAESLPVSETSPLGRAESPYAFSKQIGERMLEDFAQTGSPVRMVALRYFNPVGAHLSGLNGESPTNPPTSLVPIICQTAAGLRDKMMVYGTDYSTRDGSCVRDYIHVSDIAEAHLKALDFLIENRNISDYEIINLGTGEGVTVVEALQAFEKVTGIRPNYELGPRRPGDVAAVYSDTVKSREMLGWKAKHGIETMMETAWKWQQACS